MEAGRPPRGQPRAPPPRPRPGRGRVRPEPVRLRVRRRRPPIGHASLRRRPCPGREAHDRRPRRVALPQAAARAAHRGGARPPQRRGVPRLHPWLPLLPGRHDHPAGARAARRPGPHDGERRPPSHRLRRGGAHVAVDRRLLRHRRGHRRRVRSQRAVRSGRARVGEPAEPPRRRLHRGDRRQAPAGPAQRAHLRPRGGHVAHAPGDQQAHHRGGPLHLGRGGVLPGLEAGEALLPHRSAHRDRRGHPRHRRARSQRRSHRPEPQQGSIGDRLGRRVRAQGPHPVPVVRSEHRGRAAPEDRPVARRPEERQGPRQGERRCQHEVARPPGLGRRRSGQPR